MALSLGIVGLPNVGKSTLFNALTSSRVEASNYPFCTIDPNVGIVNVPDPRLLRITELIRPKKTVPTTIQFVDIAGLVKGASKGEGLGNQFLGHIRQTDAVVQVVRCFENSEVVHVEGGVNPVRDIETIQTELALADLETAARAAERSQKQARSGAKEDLAKAQFYQNLERHLAAGHPARSLAMKEEERPWVAELHLLTAKPILYLCNVGEEEVARETPNEHVRAVRELAAKEKAEVVIVSAKVEAEIAELPETERDTFLKELGLTESGLDRVIRAGYQLLGLITYFTAGEKECRAWTVLKGSRAPQAAGVIHSDFERGFICAEIYHAEDLFTYKSEAQVRAKGLIRLEGKEYVMKDGDVAHFRFNV